MPGEPDAPERLDDLSASLVPTSRRKVVLLAVAVVVVALAIAFGVFQAISAGIESAAPRAADYLSPEAEPGEAPPPRSPPAPSEAPPVPGL